MKAKEVPQDESILEGNRRACYAEDEHGRYVVVPSKGWEVEKIVNAQAHEEIDRETEEARRDFFRGTASPLKYHMLRRQMTPRLLASTTGLWGFQVKKHLTPKGFEGLRPEVMALYADALGLSVEELRTVPPKPAADGK